PRPPAATCNQIRTVRKRTLTAVFERRGFSIESSARIHPGPLARADQYVRKLRAGAGPDSGLAVIGERTVADARLLGHLQAAPVAIQRARVDREPAERGNSNVIVAETGVGDDGAAAAHAGSC